MKLFGRKVRFEDPISSDVVIFDECNSNITRRAIHTKYSVSVLNMRPLEIYLSWKVMFYLFQFLWQLVLKSDLKYKSIISIEILRQLKYIYLKACLVVINPKAVITLIDNSYSFSWLSKNCRNFPFIAIQNGSRLSYAAKEKFKFFYQHLFCFGMHEVIQFKRLSYEVENAYPVGSLVASLYFDTQVSNVDIEYDLLIVSTWRGNIGFHEDVRDTLNSMKIMDCLLARYVVDRGIKAAVMLRAERGSEHWYIPEIKLNEAEYYRGIYGDTIAILETNFSERNIFSAIQKSELIISCLSTALLEAYGIGKKILYCNFTGKNLYHQDFDDAILTSNQDYVEFSKILDDLLNMSGLEYSKIHKDKKKYYMNFPNDGLTSRAVMERISEIIEAKK